MKIEGGSNLEFLLNEFSFEKANAGIKQGFVLEGGCFYKNQLIITDTGSKKISQITANDKVLSFNHKTKSNEYQNVLNVIKKSNKEKCYKITLNNGKIIKVTENHKFFYQQRYVEIKNIVSLWKKQNEKNK